MIIWFFFFFIFIFCKFIL